MYVHLCVAAPIHTCTIGCVGVPLAVETYMYGKCGKEARDKGFHLATCGLDWLITIEAQAALLIFSRIKLLNYF